MFRSTKLMAVLAACTGAPPLINLNFLIEELLGRINFRSLDHNFTKID